MKEIFTETKYGFKVSENTDTSFDLSHMKTNWWLVSAVVFAFLAITIVSPFASLGLLLFLFILILHS